MTAANPKVCKQCTEVHMREVTRGFLNDRMDVEAAVYEVMVANGFEGAMFDSD